MLAPAAMVAPGEVGRPTGGLERFRMEISGRPGDRSPPVGDPLGDRADAARSGAVPRGGDRAASRTHDEMVRQWYRAHRVVDAAARGSRQVHTSIAPAPSSRTIPTFLFLSACQREAYAGAADPDRGALGHPADRCDVGRRIGTRGAARGGSVCSGGCSRSDRIMRKRGMRYGRVLGGLGKHAEAAVELRSRRSRPGRSARCCYCAELFLGAEEEALGNRDARARWRTAGGRALSPMAQSPLVALSQLARRYGRSRRRAARDRAACSRFQDDDRGRAGRSLVVVLRRAGARRGRAARGDGAAVSGGAPAMSRRLERR